ncbi:MAG: hypothetical protein IPP94_19840 [Ignavibacteria bacterium]|nr:hypothetical protein [Ignavibacteria bacterium]
MPLSDVKDLLVTGYNSDAYRSDAYRTSAYDILAHRAVEFFADGRTGLPSASGEFGFETLDGLLPTLQFVEQRLEPSDSSDNARIALGLYRHLLRAHLGDAGPDALVDLDLLRLDFARRITRHDNKDTAYFGALVELYLRHASASISAEVGYRMAQYHYDRGDYPAALAICEREIERFPDSRGGVHSENLRAKILTKELDFFVEKSVLPGKPILVAVRYRNLSRVYCRILAEKQYRQMYEQFEQKARTESVRILLESKILEEWTVELPGAQDYQRHVVDIAAPSMPVGNYIMVVSTREDFSRTKPNTLAVCELHVTGLSMQSQHLRDQSDLLWIRDAENGYSLPGVTAHMYHRRENWSISKVEKIPVRDALSDSNGCVRLEFGASNTSINVALECSGDTFDPGESYHKASSKIRGETARGVFHRPHTLPSRTNRPFQMPPREHRHGSH